MRCLAVLVAFTAVTLVPAVPATAYSGAFLSAPHQPAPQSFSGNDVVISNRSYVGLAGGAALTVHDAHNVDITNIDFDSVVGGLYLSNVTGTIHIEGIRCRNIGDGTIGSGHSNCIQLANTWQGAAPPANNYARIRSIKLYGGNTEDAISIYKSGGVDAAHPMVLGDIHEEHPLTGALAWTSGSGTCINLADGGGHDTLLRNSTFLNCGAVGIQMNEPTRVVVQNNVVYGAARTTSNVGLSQWSGGSCSSCTGNAYVGNKVNWKKASGSQSDIWLSNRYPVTLTNNVKNAAIDPAALHVAL